jgi:hypothetical protein
MCLAGAGSKPVLRHAGLDPASGKTNFLNSTGSAEGFNWSPAFVGMALENFLKTDSPT